ncbi:PIN domain-containing protein [Halovivax limisalsi]|uniref:PIN domain-containing protein n=1 Tax=Halovivax limisalsi TaxID=1453760 RepID=UPI001FFCBCF4|nr:PIN domain-containing protein [Halovivax limisalsi]
MTVYDSSVLIDYLDGSPEALSYVESNLDDRAIGPPLVVFEVYQGEVYRSGPPDFDAVDRALEWVTVVNASSELARTTAELQTELMELGQPLAARDALIAGFALVNDDRLVVSDDDFDVSGMTDLLDVDFL